MDQLLRLVLVGVTFLVFCAIVAGIQLFNPQIPFSYSLIFWSATGLTGFTAFVLEGLYGDHQSPVRGMFFCLAGFTLCAVVVWWIVRR
jgi:hypothetical protein